eukprot:1488997-Amphidinium_carterae.1
MRGGVQPEAGTTEVASGFQSRCSRRVPLQLIEAVVPCGCAARKQPAQAAMAANVASKQGKPWLD